MSLKKYENTENKNYFSLTYLVSRLPDVCQHIIYKHLHRMYMVDLQREIMHNVVWVRLRSGNNYRYQFLTSTQTNYPVWEDSDNEE